MKLGFVGLGSMGSAMAMRLIDAGHDVTVWNRTPSTAEPLVSAGAKLAGSVAEVFELPVVFSMLANDQAALEQFTHEMLSGAAPGTIHVNHSSLSLTAADELAERHASAGVGYLSAPVLGRPPVAAAGALNILIGGNPVLVSKVQELLDVLGKKTWFMGEQPRSANLVKIGVNFNIIHALQALSESVALMERGGVDAELFVELLTSSLFGGVAYTGYGNAIATRTYRPAGFTLELGRKDLRLVEEASREMGISLATVPALREVFEKALADPELAGADWAAIAEVARES